MARAKEGTWRALVFPRPPVDDAHLFDAAGDRVEARTQFRHHPVARGAGRRWPPLLAGARIMNPKPENERTPSDPTATEEPRKTTGELSDDELKKVAGGDNSAAAQLNIDSEPGTTGKRMRC